jgi:signal peptidase I
MRAGTPLGAHWFATADGVPSAEAVDARTPPLLDDVHADEPSNDFDDVLATGARRNRRRRSATRNAIEWALVLVGALVVALVVKTWLFQAFYIPSGSMEPTLEIGDRVLVNKLSYDIDDVRRGHIVVFSRPDDWSTGNIEDLIKRVIGLPGDEVSARDGHVYIDGELLDEPWLAPEDEGLTVFAETSGCVPSCTLGENEVFVLGDNRDNSSASNMFGPIDFDHVVGRAVIRVWPIGSFGRI